MRVSNVKIVHEVPFEQAIRNSMRPCDKSRVYVGKKYYSVSRLKTFAIHGCKCVRCGKEGNKVLAWLANDGVVHVDLFHVPESGETMLMNRDHIIPRSKKGGNEHWNLQPMCERCNSSKGANETPEDIEARKFRDRWKKVHHRINKNHYFWVANPIVRFISRYSKPSVKIINTLRNERLYGFSRAIAKITA